MKKIRCMLAAIALLATLVLSGLSVGVGSLANAASNGHAGAASVAGHATKSVAFTPSFPCPGGGGWDC